MWLARTSYSVSWLNTSSAASSLRNSDRGPEWIADSSGNRSAARGLCAHVRAAFASAAVAVLPVGVRQRMDHAIVHSDVSQNRLITPHALEHDHSLYARWMS